MDQLNWHELQAAESTNTGSSTNPQVPVSHGQKKEQHTQKLYWGHFGVWRNGRGGIRKHSTDDMMAHKNWQMMAEMMGEENLWPFPE